MQSTVVRYPVLQWFTEYKCTPSSAQVVARLIDSHRRFSLPVIINKTIVCPFSCCYFLRNGHTAIMR